MNTNVIVSHKNILNYLDKQELKIVPLIEFSFFTFQNILLYYISVFHTCTLGTIEVHAVVIYENVMQRDYLGDHSFKHER